MRAGDTRQMLASWRQLSQSFQTEGTMAYAFANPAAHGVRSHRRLHPANDALDPARGIVAWTLISAVIFWLPLGIALMG